MNTRRVEKVSYNKSDRMRYSAPKWGVNANMDLKKFLRKFEKPTRSSGALRGPRKFFFTKMHFVCRTQ